MIVTIRSLLRTVFLHTPGLRSHIGMPRSVTLVRHGQSVRNIALTNKLHIAEKDKEGPGNLADYAIPLTPKGEEDARAGGRILAEKIGHPDVILHSPYVRTTETARLAIEALHEILPGREKPAFIETKLVRERESGYSYFMTDKERDEHFPWNQDFWMKNGPYLTRPIGGESIPDVEHRIATVWDELCTLYAGKHVCIFTHGRFIQAWNILFREMKLAEATAYIADPGQIPANGSLTVYTYDPKRGGIVFTDYFQPEAAVEQLLK